MVCLCVVSEYDDSDVDYRHLIYGWQKKKELAVVAGKGNE